MNACCPSSTPAMVNAHRKIALVGNPNCGKTTLFNRLTGSSQKVGNWPGVTVEKKSGILVADERSIELIDLPGIYSLVAPSSEAALDERIAADFIAGKTADLIINIVDASNLERHLYLTAQLLEMRVPLVLVLNMMDMARAKKLQIDIAELSSALKCPVIPISAHKGEGLAQLKETLCRLQIGASERLWSYPSLIEEVIDQENDPAVFTRQLEGDIREITPEQLSAINHKKAELSAKLGEDVDILIADTRYQFITQLLNRTLKQSGQVSNWSARLDRIFLNRVLGIPLFLGIMYLLFVFAINIGGAFQDFFDIGSDTIFVSGLSAALTALHFPNWLIVLLANGIGKGINTTITFIPVIGAMFLFLAFLEDSGYMARAAFVVDRFMQSLGLPGKAFVPMIVGFGCNVPAVMGARTLENKRDRILTIMMSPFMSCGARLAIFAVFTAAFFRENSQNIVFALYLIGILMAILTGVILRKTVLQGESAPLVMELPPYHMPQFRSLALHAWQRLSGFVLRAGRLIVPICVLIGALNSLNVNGTLNQGEGDVESLLSAVGRTVTPLFAPMGLHENNWPATVGLVTGILAKEVVVGTLNTLYSQAGHLALATDTFSFWGGLQEAWQSIPANLTALKDAWTNPILAKAPIHAVNQGVYGLMADRFDGKVGAFAYLLFVLLYFPCVSTTAAMLRELNKGWSIFSIFWMTGVAYGTAVVFYQAATFFRHPMSSMLWVSAIFSAFIFTLYAIRSYALQMSRVEASFKEVRT